MPFIVCSDISKYTQTTVCIKIFNYEVSKTLTGKKTLMLLHRQIKRTYHCQKVIEGKNKLNPIVATKEI